MDNGIQSSPGMYSNPDTHTGGPELGFATVLQMDLTQTLVPSVAQANIKGVDLVLH